MPDEPVQTTNNAALHARVQDELSRACSKHLEPALYLVATPIGNLADITIRALGVLSQADVIYAEDTRHSAKLLNHYGITQPMRPYHDHNAARERPNIIASLNKGLRVALISDAGTPLISDPGYKLVREVIDEGQTVISIPGPSAALAGLCSSGLPTNAFMFAGFMPPKKGERQTKLEQLKSVAATLVFFEAPSRIPALIGDLYQIFGPRYAVIARELTKLHEDIIRGALDDLKHQVSETSVKGECVVLVAPPTKDEVNDDDILEHLAIHLDKMSLRDAARQIANELSVSKTRVYDLGLTLKNNIP